jgi:hypothetical protein
MTYTHSSLLDDLYARVGSEKYEAIRKRVADTAQKRTRALAKIRDKAFRDYCRAEDTFNKHWLETWNAVRDEVLAEEGIE